MLPTRPIARLIPNSDFARTHCMRCQAGWTRTIANGTKAVLCLLDLQPIPESMVSCDRYVAREE